jgi:signal transduction histidine kinase
VGERIMVRMPRGGVVEAPVERPAARRLARTLWAVAIGFGALYGGLLLLNRGTHLPGAMLELLQSPPFLLVGGTIGLLVASRRPSNPIGWILLLMAVTVAIQEALDQYAILSYLTRREPLPSAVWAAWAQVWLLQSFFPIVIAVMLMLFPDGHFLSAPWRWLAIGALILNGIALIGMALTPGPLEPACCALTFPVSNPLGVSFLSNATEAIAGGPSSSIGATAITVLGIVIMFPAAIASLALRRRRGSAEVRDQIGLVLVTIVIAGILLLSGVVVALAASGPTAAPIFNVAISVVAIGLPAAIGVAILRHRLFDVDVVIRKTVLYATTAILLVATFVLVAVLVGSVAGRSQAGAVVAALVIGLAFQPATRVARKIADRIVYGKRATPFEVLAQFAERVGDTQVAEDTLPSMARVLGEAVGARHSEVWLHVGRELRVAASWPPGTVASESVPMVGDELPDVAGAGYSVPVRDGTQLLGALAVSKAPNDPITPAESKLVSHLASQAALVLRNVRLIEELRASRQRLVRAQDEERRRLERNIHDGAQQQLVALAVKLRLLQQLSERDPAKAKELAGALQGEAQTALEDLRVLARGIYPPLLADQGLQAALSTQAGRSPIPVTVVADGVVRYPRDIEAAVYFCCLEAMQNAAKHAGGGAVTVRLRSDRGELAFDVADDGPGFDPMDTSYGTGLQGMIDRLEAVGGRLEVRSSPGAGTRIAGRIAI